MDMNLQGKRALVTGSSSGIGTGIARMLSAEGASVVVHGRNPDRTTAVADELRALGGSVAYVLGDLETNEGGDNVVKGALDAFGGIDILVNNAGGRGNGGSKTGWFEMTVEDWDQTYNMNVLSAVRLILPLVPAMKERGWGRIINVSSSAAQAPSGVVGEYAAAKAGMSNVAITLSKTLAKTGVTVNTVSPGMTRTTALEALLTNVAVRQGFGPDVEKGARWMLDNAMRQTVDRLGTPEDIAYAVCFLASPNGDFINGANIRVDGGAAPAIN